MGGKFPERKDISESFLEVSFCERVGDESLFRYFGRAKELPGVRELFQSRKKEEEEENAMLNYYKKFMDQGGEYFGDGTEELDEEERKEEMNGELISL